MNRHMILAAAISGSMLMAGLAKAQITVSGPATISGAASLVVGSSSYEDYPSPEVFSGGSSSLHANVPPPDGVIGGGGGSGTWPSYGTYSSISFVASAGAGGNNESAGNSSEIIANGSISMGFTSTQPISYDISVASSASASAYRAYSNWSGSTPATISANVIPLVAGLSLGVNPGATVLMQTAHFDSPTSIDDQYVSHVKRVVGTAPANAFAISVTAEATIPYQENEYIYSRSGGASSTISGSVAAIANTSAPIEYKSSDGPYESVGVGGGTTVQVDPDDASGFRTNELLIDSTGKFDIQDGTVIVNYAGTSPLSTIRSKIASGYNAGAWNGYGIISSTAASTSGFGIGYAEASAIGLTSWGGDAVDSTSVVIDYCLYGDTNLSGTVDFDDLLKANQNYNGSNKLWEHGDFDYDGDVDFNDLLRIYQNYELSGLTEEQASVLSPAFVEDFMLVQSLAPEPASALGLTLITAMVRRRKSA